MSKPRRPRNARHAPKPVVAKPGATAAALPVSEAEAGPPAADLPPLETIVADPVPAPSEMLLHDTTAAADAAPGEDAPHGEPGAVGEPASGPGPAPSPSRPAIAAASYGPSAFGTTVMDYVIGEGEAFAAHLRALAGARSVAEFVRLQIGEFQRAADATLTCWGILALSASRSASLR